VSCAAVSLAPLVGNPSAFLSLLLHSSYAAPAAAHVGITDPCGGVCFSCVQHIMPHFTNTEHLRFPSYLGHRFSDSRLLAASFFATGSVGLYVPGGTAVLPSSALMLAVPAAIAGCQTIVLATPPRPDGSITPEVSGAR
jgi:hypothetical protein